MSPAEKLKQYANAVEKAIDPKAFAFLVSGDDPRSVPSIIKKRTQLGYGVPSEGAGNTKLKSLSAKYIIFRQKNKAGNLSSNTTPKRSNLTLTGDMLNSIVGVQNGLRFTFFFSTPESDKKARLNRENGRRFFDLSKSERMGLQRQISAIMRESLRALFK